MLTDFTENKILDAIFGRRTWSGKPTTLFLSAMTSIPSDTGGGTEVVGNGHSRRSVACNSSNWRFDAAQSALVNDNDISWSVATASWGLVTAIGVYSAATGGTLSAYFALDTPIQIEQFFVLKINAGELRLSLTGALSDAQAQRILEYLFMGSALPVVTNFHVGLGTGIGDKYLTGEIDVFGYERIPIANSQGNWPVATAGTKFSANTHLSPVALINNWGAATHMALFDAKGILKVVTFSMDDSFTTETAHGLAAGDAVLFMAGTFPTFSGTVLTNNAVCFVKSVLSSTKVTLSPTSGVSNLVANVNAAALANSGNAIRLYPMDATTKAVGAHTVDNLINSTAHGFVAGDRVHLTGTVPPTGLSLGANYWVIEPTANNFQLSLTEDGAAIVITSEGTAAMFRRFKRGTMLFFGQLENSLAISVGDDAQLTAGSLEITLD
jgi:hypothetical protein